MDIANFFVKSHGYKTILYTDSQGYDLYKNIKFDEFRELPQNILDQFPSVGWSLGKLLTVSLIKEPFLHFDFDLFLTKPLENNILQKDVVFLHQEIWMDFILKQSSRIIQKKPSILENINSSYRSYNCAIFGGNNFEAFNKASKEVIEFAIKHKDFLEKIVSSQDSLKDKGLVNYYTYFPMILEQLWLPEILKLKQLNCETILFTEEIKKIEEIDFSTEVNLNDFDHSEYLKKYKNHFLNYERMLGEIAKSKVLLII